MYILKKLIYLFLVYPLTGTYLYKIEGDNFSQTKKMILLK